MRILVIAAHPDDEVLGMGGTIAKLSANNQVYTLIVTEGCSAQYSKANVQYLIDKKKDEAKACNKFLGVSEVFFGELPDMKLDLVPHIEINACIEKLINNLQPEQIYTHHRCDINLDHRLIYHSTMVAARPFSTTVKSIYSYEIPFSTGEWLPRDGANAFNPNKYVNISEYLTTKLKAFSYYETENRIYPHPRSPEAISICAQYRGLSVSLKYAEAFQVLRELT